MYLDHGLRKHYTLSFNKVDTFMFQGQIVQRSSKKVQKIKQNKRAVVIIVGAFG